jgi:hypothetical protein
LKRKKRIQIPINGGCAPTMADCTVDQELPSGASIVPPEHNTRRASNTGGHTQGAHAKGTLRGVVAATNALANPLANPAAKATSVLVQITCADGFEQLVLVDVRL